MIIARRAFCYRFKRRFRTTKPYARVIDRLENISLTYVFDYFIRQMQLNVFSKNIFYSLFLTIFVFWPGLFFQIIREKREKFCREYLGQAWTQVVCDSHRFHGVKFCQNLSRSQTFKQTIQIISDNGILNWKPKSISFENQILNSKIFLHLKWFFFYFERWRNVKRIH